MTNYWEPLYEEALRGVDLKMASERSDRARRAINTRLTEIASESIAAEKERERLLEALRQLLFHEQSFRAAN